MAVAACPRFHNLTTVPSSAPREPPHHFEFPVPGCVWIPLSYILVVCSFLGTPEGVVWRRFMIENVRPVLRHVFIVVFVCSLGLDCGGGPLTNLLFLLYEDCICPLGIEVPRS